MESERISRLSKIIAGLSTLMEELAEGSKTCSFECSSMSLGALLKAMRGIKLLGPKPAPPFEGFSLNALRKALHRIQTPDYLLLQHSRSDSDEYGDRVIRIIGPHFNTCYLSVRIRPIADEQYRGITGLELDGFIDMSKET
jgi:hypothetical protein